MTAGRDADATESLLSLVVRDAICAVNSINVAYRSSTTHPASCQFCGDTAAATPGLMFPVILKETKLSRLRPRPSQIIDTEIDIKLRRPKPKPRRGSLGLRMEVDATILAPASRPSPKRFNLSQDRDKDYDLGTLLVSRL